MLYFLTSIFCPYWKLIFLDVSCMTKFYKIMLNKMEVGAKFYISLIIWLACKPILRERVEIIYKLLEINLKNIR